MPRRRSRISASIVLGGVLLGGIGGSAAASDWTTFGHDVAHTNSVPHSGGLTPNRVAKLRMRWRTKLGAVSDTQPAYASKVPVGSRRLDLVFAGTEHGRVVAAIAATGHVLWHRDFPDTYSACWENTPDSRFGITATPIVDRAHNRLLVIPGDNAVHALSLSTGDEERGWPVKLGFDPKTHHVWGSPTLTGSRLYVPIASYCDRGRYRGALAFLSMRKRRVSRRWFVVGESVSGGGIWGWGGAPVDLSNGNVYVTTGNATSGQEDIDYAEHLVRLSADLEVIEANEPYFGPFTKEDADFASAPLLLRPKGCPPLVAAIHKYGELFVYRRHAVADGPVQTIAAPGGTGTFAWSPRTQTLYATGDARGLVALRASGCLLHQTWAVKPTKPMWAPSPPTVAGGVVYFGTGRAASLIAVRAGDGRVLWRSGKSIQGSVYAAPTAIEGKVFAVSWDEHMYAFDAP